MTTSSATTSPAISGKQVFVVGGTSSLGQALCHALAARGCGLIISGREEEEVDFLGRDLVARHNVPVMTMTADFVDRGFTAESFIQRAGEFDHIIIATGTMGTGEPLSLADIAFTSHINYTLPAQIATLAAIKLAEKGGGSVVLISSVAGDRGRQSNYAYGSAKAALSAFASGLRNYFFKHNVHVMTVKPGFIDTPMTWGMEGVNKSPLLASREYVADRIVRAMLSKKHPLHERIISELTLGLIWPEGKDILYVPWFWRYIMMVIRAIPEGVFKRLKL